MYKCECGKEFINPQSFNGHKSNCIEHLIAVGKIKDKQEWLDKKQAQARKSKEQRTINSTRKSEQDNKQWIAEEHICEKCGKVMVEKFGSGRFCSNACAHSYSSSQVSVHNISGLKKFTQEAHELFISRLEDYNKNPKLCTICKKPLAYERRHRTLCGDATCHAAYMSMVQKNAYNEGRRIGWKYHNEISYPEKYFMAVFDANNIAYEFQVPLFNGHSTYHLDFVINGNIDFEVDGLQHYREDYWIEHDKKRDDFVKAKGYKVYRFKWSDPKNLEEMQSKINKLLDWIKLP